MADHCALEEAGAFADVPVEIEIEVDRRQMRLRDILELAAGSVIPFPKTAGDYLDIYVGGAPVARGEVVVLEKNIGVRVTMFEAKS
jgi:flagellar motor switch protein FliN/FliY